MTTKMSYLLHGILVAHEDVDGKLEMIDLSAEERKTLEERAKAKFAGPLLPQSITDTIAVTQVDRLLRGLALSSQAEKSLREILLLGLPLERRTAQ